MADIKLTEEVVRPVMLKHNIPREEAEKRLQLLFQSNIIPTGHPDDPETQRLIDGFLAQDSTVLAATVLFEKTLTQCSESPEFVSNYDRLTGNKMAKCLEEMNAGRQLKNAKTQFKKFSKFVRETVYQRILNEAK